MYHSKKRQEEFNNLVEKLDYDSRSILINPIISGDWYNLKAYQDMLDALDGLYGQEELISVIFDLAKPQLSGLFGFFIKFISPEKVISKCHKRWNKLNLQINTLR